MKVDFVIPARPRCGIAVYSQMLLAALRPRLDLTVLAVPLDQAKDSFLSLAEQINRSRSSITHVQYAPGMWGGDRQGIFYLKKFLERVSKPCLLTLHEVGRDRREYIRMQNVADMGTNLKNAQFNLWYGKLLNQLFARTVNLADRLMVHTHFQKAELIRSGVAEDKVDVVTHGIPPAQACTGNTVIKARYQLQGKFVIATFGFIKRFKNYAQVFEVLRGLPDDIFYIIAGGAQDREDEEYLNELMELRQRLKLEGKVKITGYLTAEEIDAYHALADVMIFPYRNTTASGAMAHAMAYGKPVIASDLPAHREINAAYPDTLGIYAAGKELKAWIERLFRNQEEITLLEKKARVFALENSFERMAERTVESYKKINTLSEKHLESRIKIQELRRSPVTRNS